MAEKSKYLIWLENLHREYTCRTSITVFGQHARLLHLLADMYEVRCRFERILERLKQEAMPLDDEGLDYQEWYNPEIWKRGETVLYDEDVRNTFGFKASSPLAQTYANSLLTPFGDKATFNVDNFRDVVSSLFVFDQIVDTQKMEVAIEDELRKLQTVLLNISNAKESQKTDEEYAVYFKKQRVAFITGFLKKSSIVAAHNQWKSSISEDITIDVLQERRIELLLAIFESGFLDEQKKANHRKATDVLGFKDYEFDGWSERIDEAVKYFASLCKLCPFTDNMIDFSHDDKLGKYIISHHIEQSIVTSFLEKMELINMVQKEMKRLDNPDIEDEGDADSPVELFVERVKHIMLKAEEDNGTIKPLTARGNGGKYKYEVDGKGFCKVMEELLACHEREIKDYLQGATAEEAITIKYVAPFIGFVLDTHLYSPQSMPKKDMNEVLEIVYGKGTSAVSKMSKRKRSNEAEILFKTAEDIMKKHKNG